MIKALAIGIAWLAFVWWLRSWVIRWEIHRHWTRVRPPERYWKKPPDIAGMIGPIYSKWWPHG